MIFNRMDIKEDSLRWLTRFLIKKLKGSAISTRADAASADTGA